MNVKGKACLASLLWDRTKAINAVWVGGAEPALTGTTVLQMQGELDAGFGIVYQDVRCGFKGAVLQCVTGEGRTTIWVAKTELWAVQELDEERLQILSQEGKEITLVLHGDSDTKEEDEVNLEIDLGR